MARLLTSAVLLATAALAGAQAFGRFGYSEQISAPGFLLHHDGFQVDAPGAAVFEYRQPYDQWRVSDLSDMGVTALVSTTGLRPRKVRISELVPGFSLFFDSGFSFTVRTKECPYLTWPDGSVGPDVPTPEVAWVLVSFQQDQPPLLLSFPDGPCAVRAGGSAGDWTIRSVDVAPHWVHMAAPLGSAVASTTSAAQLGSLVQKITPTLDVWTSLEPIFKSLDVSADETSVTGTWHFDRPGFLIPSAPQFAGDGGYLAQIQSPVRDLGLFSDGLPEVVSSAKDLVVRFPVRKASPGLALALGAQPIDAPPPASLQDLSGIVKVALTGLLSTCDPKTRQLPGIWITRFINETQDTPEPFSGEQMPFKGDGKGTDTVAAFALLQTTGNAAAGEKAPNALLLSLLFRRDWDSWLLPDSDQDRQRRAVAIAAVACALDSDPNSRLEGAMFEAGLAAQRGINIWKSHRGERIKETFLEPMPSLRQGLFYEGNRSKTDPFIGMLMSPVHVVASLPVQAAQYNSQDFSVSWFSSDTAPQDITFESVDKLEITKGKNVLTLTVSTGLLGLTARALPGQEGPTELRLNSSQPLELPPFAFPPAYSELRR